MLEGESWARERLAAHAGRVFVIVIGPVATAFRIDATGQLATTPLSGRAPDLTLTISPFGVLSLLANPGDWRNYVAAEGDPALAATLQDLAHTLPWFVERAFGNALGPIIGQRAADAGRRLLAFPEYVANRIGDSFVSYARDEAGLLVHADELRVFATQTARLSERTDELEVRLDALVARQSVVPAKAGTQ